MHVRNDSHFRQPAGKRLLIPLLALLVAIPGCSDDDAADDRVLVVVTTNILGDLVRNVVGDDARVEVLMPLGVDPHDFEPSSRQAAAIAAADLVVINGLDLEPGLEDVIEGARGDGTPVFAVAELVDPIPFVDQAAENAGGDEDGQNHGDLDPHVWMDPLRMAHAARLLGARLSGVDPSVDWSASADGYAAELEAAHARVEAILSSIPSERRALITNHEALGYFAARYGFEVIGVVIPGGTTLAEPGSQQLAALVTLIDERRIAAIFAETTEPVTLAKALAAEADHPVEVVILHTESLGEPGSPAATLVGMLEVNARLIAGALG